MIGEGLPPLKVLLVEGDPRQSANMLALLRNLGHTALEASDSAQAVERFRCDNPDLVLMDESLPGSDGLDTTCRIKSMAGERWIPVVYLTTLGKSDSVVEILLAGGDDYLTKPVGQEMLEAKLRSVSRTLKLYRALEESREQLTSAQAALRHANRELETFTYAVAHDLKSPLRAINGYGTLLASTHAAALDEEGRDYLHKIVQGTEHMERLIDDLLEYSRLERGAVSFERIDLLRQTDLLKGEFRDEIERLGARIALKAECVDVTADRNGLTLALRNLLSNALKFSDAARPLEIEIGYRYGDGLHHIWVGDNGIGFDTRHHDRIFDIFERLHRSEDYPGTGVGLAIVRKAMQRMRGRCWATSTPGQGATFHLQWPEPDAPQSKGSQAL